MKIGFSQNYDGPGGARSRIKSFSKYCINNGHTVSYGFDDTVDVFCSVANLSTIKQLKLLKEKNIKILQRLGAIYLPYNHPNPILIKNKNTELKVIFRKKLYLEVFTMELSQMVTLFITLLILIYLIL